MMKALVFGSLTLVLSSQGSKACDCFGNNSYCETLSPTWLVNPSTTVLAEKLDDYFYGIHVKIVQVIAGEVLPSDTLLVWGDNGGLCRVNLNGFAIGDTVVFGLNHCDLWGNTITAGFPPDLEHLEDYQVSVCGIYWLNYVNGNVQGQITGPVFQNMPLDAFIEVVQNCSAANAINEVGPRDPLLVRYVAGVPVLERPGQSGPMALLVVDAQGRMVLRRAWNGQTLPFSSVAPGVYTARVSIGGEHWTRKILVE